jgi:hypothetical protein
MSYAQKLGCAPEFRRKGKIRERNLEAMLMYLFLLSTFLFSPFTSVYKVGSRLSLN